ncbi:unnamed protein product [Paramecium pentaurelia]|uniref:Uncharacterized protein n=1 Tax=Paramecium pentaurelia TaxID=43138 RepID=A0A8S1V461_9CILI|nr:unnamed protein product [Paramecium pentaurelia]
MEYLQLIVIISYQFREILIFETSVEILNIRFRK